MFYQISRTLEALPYLSWVILAVALVLLEIKSYRERQTVQPEPEPGRGGFVPPPGNGYEYFVTSGRICYILRKSKRVCRVYVVQGQNPGVNLKHDRYGQYFTVQAQDLATAEKIVDAAFGV